MASEVDTKDVVSVMNRLNYLSEKSRVGTSGMGGDLGKEFKGGLTPEENDEFDKLSAISEKLLKSKDTRPVYSVKNPDGTTTLTYTNPTAKEEEAYRQKYGANTSLAQAGMSPYSGGKVLNWKQKQEAMKRVEELRPNYANLSYAQQQEFDAIQRNLYASVAVNEQNPNPAGANATSIYDNTPELMKQYGQWGPSAGVQVGAQPGSMPGAGPAKTVVNEIKDASGLTITQYSDGTVTTTTKEGVTTPFGSAAGGAAGDTTQLPTTSAAQEKRQSAYDLLYEEFDKYGLASLVTPLKSLIMNGTSDSEFTIRLRETPEYQKRFAANKARIANGFKAIDEATYLGLEDKYQSIMQNYGLPPQYYAKGDLGVQEGFVNLIAGNVDPITLEERVLEGKKLNDSTKETLAAAKKFYPSLTDGDFLAYVLDPKNALSDIKRKVTASEIGGAQMGAGLAATAAGAESLAGAGVTGAQYLQASPFIAEAAKRGSELSSFYGQTPYNQTTAEAEALNLAGGAQAAADRKKLKSLEEASFSGSSGVGALGRDKSIYGSTYGQAGLV